MLPFIYFLKGKSFRLCAFIYEQWQIACHILHNWPCQDVTLRTMAKWMLDSCTVLRSTVHHGYIFKLEWNYLGNLGSPALLVQMLFTCWVIRRQKTRYFFVEFNGSSLEGYCLHFVKTVQEKFNEKCAAIQEYFRNAWREAVSWQFSMTDGQSGLGRCHTLAVGRVHGPNSKDFGGTDISTTWGHWFINMHSGHR